MIGGSIEIKELEGFYPIKLQVVHGIIFFELRKLPETVFEETFFFFGLKNLPSASPEEIKMCGLNDFEQLSSCYPVGCFAGIIFHLSRCGSTLVTQTLATLSSTRTISEPGILTNLLEYNKNGLISDGDAQRVFKVLVKFWSQKFDTYKIQLVLKPISILSAHYSFFLKSFKHIPSIFIIRNPAEIMVSMLENPNYIINNFRGNLDIAASSIDSTVAQINDLSIEDYLGLLVQRSIKQIINNLHPNTIIIDHKELPGAIFDQILPHFDLNPTNQEMDKIKLRVQYHGKNRKRKYESDIAMKTIKITKTINDSVKKNISPHMEILRKISKEQQSIH